MPFAPAEEGPPKYLLPVDVVSARDLPNADTVGKSDPFVEVCIEGKPKSSCKSKTAWNELNPQWDFDGLVRDYVPGDNITINVYDKDILGRELLGTVTVPSADFHPDGFLQKEVKLETPDYDGESFLTIGISSFSEAVNGRRNMLSDKQVNDVIDRVNENIDIVGLSSKTERKLIAGPVHLMNKLLKRGMLAFCSPDWVKAVSVLLDDQIQGYAKSEKMLSILQDAFVSPLAKSLNKKNRHPRPRPLVVATAHWKGNIPYFALVTNTSHWLEK